MYKGNDEYFLIDGRLWRVDVDTEWQDDETSVVGYTFHELIYDPSKRPEDCPHKSPRVDVSVYPDHTDSGTLTDLDARTYLHNEGEAEWTPLHDVEAEVEIARTLYETRRNDATYYRVRTKEAKEFIPKAVEVAERDYQNLLMTTKRTYQNMRAARELLDAAEAKLKLHHDPT